jgi:hypothetical protein
VRASTTGCHDAGRSSLHPPASEPVRPLSASSPSIPRLSPFRSRSRTRAPGAAPARPEWRPRRASRPENYGELIPHAFGVDQPDDAVLVGFHSAHERLSCRCANRHAASYREADRRVAKLAAGRRLLAQRTCSGATVRAHYSPRVLAPERGEHVMEARLMPHAQYVAVAILVDGQVRAAQAFNYQTDALRWAEEQRVIHALEAR